MILLRQSDLRVECEKRDEEEVVQRVRLPEEKSDARERGAAGEEDLVLEDADFLSPVVVVLDLLEVVR